MAKPSSLVIVESPSKAKTIGKYLGPEYTVKASMGHLRDLPKSKMGVDFENGFKPDYRPITGKKEIIDDLKSTAAEKADSPQSGPKSGGPAGHLPNYSRCCGDSGWTPAPPFG